MTNALTGSPSETCVHRHGGRLQTIYIRHLDESGLMPSSVSTSMRAVRASSVRPESTHAFRRSTPTRPAPRGLDRLELIRFLQVAQTITVHHGALAYLFGINALRASEAAAVRSRPTRDPARPPRAALGRQGQQAATMPITVPVLRVLEACRGQRTAGPLILRPLSGKYGATPTEWSCASRRPPAFHATSARTHSATRRSPTLSTPASHSATPRSSPVTPTPHHRAGAYSRRLAHGITLFVTHDRIYGRRVLRRDAIHEGPDSGASFRRGSRASARILEQGLTD